VVGSGGREWQVAAREKPDPRRAPQSAVLGLVAGRWQVGWLNQVGKVWQAGGRAESAGAEMRQTRHDVTVVGGETRA